MVRLGDGTEAPLTQRSPERRGNRTAPTARAIAVAPVLLRMTSTRCRGRRGSSAPWRLQQAPRKNALRKRRYRASGLRVAGTVDG